MGVRRARSTFEYGLIIDCHRRAVTNDSSLAGRFKTERSNAQGPESSLVMIERLKTEPYGLIKAQRLFINSYNRTGCSSNAETKATSLGANRADHVSSSSVVRIVDFVAASRQTTSNFAPPMDAVPMVQWACVARMIESAIASPSPVPPADVEVR